MLAEFRRHFIVPIKNGQRSNASAREIVDGKKATVALNKYLKGVILRRDKSIIKDLLPGTYFI